MFGGTNINNNTIDISTDIATVGLSSCIYGASGILDRNLDEILLLCGSSAGAVVSKSCTKKPRNGNPGYRYYSDADEQLSINSSGLPNNGYEYYSKLCDNPTVMSKPYCISVAAMDLSDTICIIRNVARAGPRFMEINMSCPNINGKDPLCYDFDAFEEYCRRIAELDLMIPYGYKLGAYYCDSQFGKVADILNDVKPGFVVSINSMTGFCMSIDTDKPILTPNSGYGGIGGRGILPFALANIRKLYSVLDGAIDIVGCGGVSTGADVYAMLACGAVAVQVGTALSIESVGIFDRLNTEFTNILKEKNLKCINDIPCV